MEVCLMGLNTFEEVWEKIISLEGQEFKTVSNLPFTYSIIGNALKPSRAKQIISKNEIKKAYDQLQLEKPSDIIDTVRGPSYVFALLHDKRIK
jgi:hypothetical protein